MNSINWDHVKDFFKPREFDDPHYPGSGKNFNGALFAKLYSLRKRTGWPIITHYGVGGCIDVDGRWGHSPNSYHLLKNGGACDFHFDTDADPRKQYRMVEEALFGGIGVYYTWLWDGKLLPIAFHVDDRPRIQRWVCRNKGEYLYLLGR